MKKQIIIVRTQKGGGFSQVLQNKIAATGLQGLSVYWKELPEFLSQHPSSPQDTIFHFRSAGSAVNRIAHRLETEGYRVINAANVLDRTADKFYSYQWATDHGIQLPWTHKATREDMLSWIQDHTQTAFVLKPVNSISQGAYCFRSSSDDPELATTLAQVPGKNIIAQEYIPYIRIYRVVVINHQVLDKAVFSDEPTEHRWKVSVCLNPEIQHVKHPDPKLLDYAQQLAQVFESEIAFIDIFQTEAGYVLSEINTACNLIRHEQLSGYDISGDIVRYLTSQL